MISFKKLLALLYFFSQCAFADFASYSQIVDLSVETAAVQVQHHHDWSTKEYPGIDKVPVVSSSQIHVSYLSLRDKSSGAELFHRSAPALTYLWISEDSKYIVGVSNVKYLNPTQLVVFNKSGKLLLEKSFVGFNTLGMRMAGVSESVTNYVTWYKEPNPKIMITELEKTATLAIEDPLGGFRQFQFPASHAKQ